MKVGQESVASARIRTAMALFEARRTLVKSPPELWAEVADAGSLARHLGEFGEIRITRLQPETVVEWEGDHAAGAVRLEPSGWGTRVTISAERIAPPAPVSPEPVAPAPVPEPPAERAGFFSRLFRRHGPGPVAGGGRSPAPIEHETTEDETDGLAVLAGVLDTLGAAHHRPFSRG